MPFALLPSSNIPHVLFQSPNDTHLAQTTYDPNVFHDHPRAFVKTFQMNASSLRDVSQTSPKRKRIYLQGEQRCSTKIKQFCNNISTLVVQILFACTNLCKWNVLSLAITYSARWAFQSIFLFSLIFGAPTPSQKIFKI